MWRLKMTLCVLCLMVSDPLPSQAQQRAHELPPPSSSRDRKAGDRARLIGITWTLPREGEGVVVQRVITGGAAEEAGLRSGDLIRVVDGRPIRGIQDAILAFAPGERVAVQYERSGRLWNTVLQVPREPLPAAPLPPPAKDQPTGGPRVRPMLGVTVKKLGARDRIELGIPQNVRGLLITSIRQGSPAARASLPAGAVILDVDGVVMSEPDDLIALVRSAKLQRPIEVRYWDRERIWRKKIKLVPELLVPQSVLELERQLELPPPPEAKSPEVPTDEVAELRRRVESLEQQVRDLTQRLEKLEQSTAHATTQPMGDSDSQPEKNSQPKKKK